jgi:hypothetical protein
VLRIVTADVQRGEAEAVIGTTQIPLPASSANDGQAVIQEIPLDPALLQPGSTIEFRCANPRSGNGYTVLAASVILTGDGSTGIPRP